jgi:ketopantoate reductase
MSESIDVLLYGLGAIGSFYAFILQKNPKVRLSVCARSNYEAVKTNGITIRSKKYGEHNLRPAKVLRAPEEAQQTYDYVVCVHKAVNTDAVLKQLVSVIDEEKTVIALMQNGVGNEDPFRAAFPGCTIISGVVSTCIPIRLGLTSSRSGSARPSIRQESSTTQHRMTPRSACSQILESTVRQNSSDWTTSPRSCATLGRGYRSSITYRQPDGKR